MNTIEVWRPRIAIPPYLKKGAAGFKDVWSIEKWEGKFRDVW